MQYSATNYAHHALHHILIPFSLNMLLICLTCVFIATIKR